MRCVHLSSMELIQHNSTCQNVYTNSEISAHVNIIFTCATLC